MLHDPNKLPKSLYEGKNVMRSLGMNYEKLHVCPNNYILYHGEEYDGLDNCPKCGESQWKRSAVLVVMTHLFTRTFNQYFKKN